MHARLVIQREVPQLAGPPQPSEVCRLLEHYSRQAVVMAMFIFQPASQEEVTARRELKRYVEEYSGVRCELDGRELMSLGLKPGPLVGEIRDKLRYLRLDGAIKSIDQEREYVAEVVNDLAKASNGHPLETEDDADEDSAGESDEPGNGAGADGEEGKD